MRPRYAGMGRAGLCHRWLRHLLDGQHVKRIAIAGLVFAVHTSAGYSLATVGTELDAIAAVVTGGSGFVPGTLVGVLIMGLIKNYIVFDGTLSNC